MNGLLVVGINTNETRFIDLINFLSKQNIQILLDLRMFSLKSTKIRISFQGLWNISDQFGFSRISYFSLYTMIEFLRLERRFIIYGIKIKVAFAVSRRKNSSSVKRNSSKDIVALEKSRRGKNQRKIDQNGKIVKNSDCRPTKTSSSDNKSEDRQNVLE